MLRIGIIGGTGKLGRDIVGLALEESDVEIGALVSRATNQYIGCDVGTLVGKPAVGMTVTDSVLESADNCDVLVDCTNAEAFEVNYDAYLTAGKPVVMATTGSGTDAQARISALSSSVPVVVCPNLSIGMYRFLELVKHAAQILDNDMDVEIIEAHHREKKDMPSGTARQIAEVIVGQRNEANIPIHSIRAGDIVGEHNVLFINNEGERIELSHTLVSRKSFAAGAIEAARWVNGRAPGVYGIHDIFGQ